MQPPHSSPSILNYFVITIILLALGACSNTRFLQKDQALYVSSKVDVKGDILVADKQDLRNSLSSKSLMLQQANKKLLGTRIKVWLYNQKYNEKKSNWFWNMVLSKRNLEEPVIYDSTKTQESVKRMTSYLNNQGFFYATVAYDQKIKNQKAAVTYKVNTGKNFVIDKITYEVADSALLNIVNKSQGLSLIKTGLPYKQEELGRERERLTRLMKDAGYYKFNRDAIEFVVDTLNKALFRNSLNPFEGFVNIFNERKGLEKPTMDVTVRIKNPEDSAFTNYEQYHINKIYVYPDYSLNSSPTDSTLIEDTSRKHITIRYHQDILRPSVLSRSILLRRGETYSQNQYNNTINRLYDLGVWQFVTLQYKENPDTPNVLDAYVFLTPKRRQVLGANFEVSNSSDYFVGTGVSLNYRHLNLNRAANQLGISLNTGLEMIRNQGNFELQSKEFGGEINLALPRFITPF
jgi:outer membrane protein insertion porin family